MNKLRQTFIFATSTALAALGCIKGQRRASQQKRDPPKFAFTFLQSSWWPGKPKFRIHIRRADMTKRLERIVR
jgi:hypothetical protein